MKLWYGFYEKLGKLTWPTEHSVQSIVSLFPERTSLCLKYFTIYIVFHKTVEVEQDQAYHYLHPINLLVIT